MRAHWPGSDDGFAALTRIGGLDFETSQGQLHVGLTVVRKIVVAAFGPTPLPVVHGVNGFRLHETAVYFERQTQFGHIPWPRERSVGVFLDPA